MEPGGEATTKKERRRGEVKARLRRALDALAADHSFLDVRVSDITSEAGLSRSAFYFYYDDKRDLLIEAVKHISEAAFDLTSGHLSREGDSRIMIREVLLDNAEAWSRNTNLLRCVIEASVYDEEVRTFWSGVIGDFTAALQDRLTADQEQHLIPEDLDVSTCVEILVTATVGFYYHRISEGETTPAEAVTALEPVWSRVLYS